MSQKKRTLGGYFDEAHRQQSLLAPDQLRSLVETGRPAKAPSLHDSNAIKWITIMTFTGILLITLYALFPTGTTNSDRAMTPERSSATQQNYSIGQAESTERDSTPAAQPGIPRAPTGEVERRVEPARSPEKNEATSASMKIERTASSTPRQEGARGGTPEKLAPPVMSGIHPLELSTADAAKLGVKFDGSELSIVERWRREDLDYSNPTVVSTLLALGLDTADPALYMSMKAAPHSVQSGLATSTEAAPVAPRIITNRYNGGSYATLFSGKLRAPRALSDLTEKELATRYKGDSLAREHAAFNRLFPIRLEPSPGWEVTLWYDLTPELIELLPAETREKIGLELASFEGMIAEAKPEKPIIAGETHLDILKMASGAVTSTRLFPIPASDRATLSFTLSAARTLRIAIHDIGGASIGEIGGIRKLDAGSFSESIDTNALKEGIYLVSVTTDRGERAIQRLVVRR